MTSSTSLGSSWGALPSTSRIAWPARSSGRVMVKEPRCDLASGVRELATTTASLMADPLLGSSPTILLRFGAAGKPRLDLGSARQARGLGAGALDLLDGLGRTGGQVVDPAGGDEDIVLDADADAPELLGDRMGDRRGLGLVLVLELLGRGHAQAQAALP